MKRLAITAILMASLMGAHEAAATPINITANRLVQVSSEITGDILGAASPSTALGSFVDSVTQFFEPVNATADQDSNIAGSSFSGSGASSIGFSILESEDASALSFFEVSFDLLTNHSYSLGGELLANVDGGRGLALFNLSGPGGFSFSALDSASTPLSQSGTLGPGSYLLTVSSLIDRGDFDPNDPPSFMGGSASYRFNFDLRDQGTPGVPEPGSMALLVLGLAIAGMRKRT